MNEISKISTRLFGEGDPEAIAWRLEQDWHARHESAITYYHERPDLLAQETAADLAILEGVLEDWASQEKWEACALLRDHLIWCRSL